MYQIDQSSDIIETLTSFPMDNRIPKFNGTYQGLSNDQDDLADAPLSPGPNIKGLHIGHVGNKTVISEVPAPPEDDVLFEAQSSPQSFEMDCSFNEGDYDEIPFAEVQQQQGTSNLKSAFFNMTNSIVGAGIVGIPRAIKSCGLATGMAALLCLAILNDWTLRLIIVNTKLSGAKTYTGFVTANYGKVGKVVVLLSQGLFAFGGSVGFSVIIGDTIPHVVRSIFADSVASSKVVNFILSRNVIIFSTISFVAYPLALNRDISKLAKASGLAIFSMLIIIVIVVIRGPQMPDSLRGSISGMEWVLQGGLFKGISIISFAMVCHHNTTYVYDSIQKPTLDRFNAITHISCLISTILCAIMGLSGFLNFGSATKGNILNNFPSDDWIVNIARFCFGLNMLTTFPLEIYVIREVVKDLLIIYHQVKYDDPHYTIQRMSTSQFVTITTFVSFLPMTISLFTCNLGAVLELVGATSASMIAYILPPLCYDHMTKHDKTTRERLPCFLCIGFGFAVMFISSTQTIIDTLNGSEGGHCVS